MKRNAKSYYPKRDRVPLSFKLLMVTPVAFTTANFYFQSLVSQHLNNSFRREMGLLDKDYFVTCVGKDGKIGLQTATALPDIQHVSYYDTVEGVQRLYEMSLRDKDAPHRGYEFKYISSGPISNPNFQAALRRFTQAYGSPFRTFQCR